MIDMVELLVKFKQHFINKLIMFIFNYLKTLISAIFTIFYIFLISHHKNRVFLKFSLLSEMFYLLNIISQLCSFLALYPSYMWITYF